MLIRSGLSIGEEVVLEPRAVSDGTPLTRRP
jgi:hypothetical protein